MLSREKAFRKAQENISKAPKQQKETYDIKHLKASWQGSSREYAQQQRKGGNMEPVRMGPYTISQCIGKGLRWCFEGQYQSTDEESPSPLSSDCILPYLEAAINQIALQKPTSEEPRNKPTTLEKPNPTIKKPQSTSMETMSKKLPPPSKAKSHWQYWQWGEKACDSREQWHRIRWRLWNKQWSTLGRNWRHYTNEWSSRGLTEWQVATTSMLHSNWSNSNVKMRWSRFFIPDEITG